MVGVLSAQGGESKGEPGLSSENGKHDLPHPVRPAPRGLFSPGQSTLQWALRARGLLGPIKGAPELSWHPQCLWGAGALLPAWPRALGGRPGALPVPTPLNTHDALGHWESEAAIGPGSGEGLPGTLSGQQAVGEHFARQQPRGRGWKMPLRFWALAASAVG